MNRQVRFSRNELKNFNVPLSQAMVTGRNQLALSIVRDRLYYAYEDLVEVLTEDDRKIVITLIEMLKEVEFKLVEVIRLSNSTGSGTNGMIHTLLGELPSESMTDVLDDPLPEADETDNFQSYLEKLYKNIDRKIN